MRKLLIANRGEIACRIARTARRIGIAVIAVHSDADEDALHIRLADEAVRIGPAAASQSYLDIAAILAAAAQTGADAIHPGYGFLSENAEFARAVWAAGLIFVGPSAEAIRAMGDKREARKLAESLGIPIVPGDGGADQSDDTLAAAAERIGWPLLIKAAAGGGGRGMRVVRDASDFAAALQSARREAKSAFGDDSVLLERLVEGSRHVEVQIFGDRFGNCVHLFERDCTAQRRHQKIVEEAPSQAVDEALRGKLGDWAVALAGAARYENAGTVEFLLDRSGDPFFLEVNTRLQVEHPVTEMVTGIDLVEWQLRVAGGEALPLRQEQIGLHGHAIEARLYAEDPAQDFLPQTGCISRFRPDEAADADRRIDAGIAEGDVVSPHYDPMVAKYVAHGATRNEARDRLVAMLEEVPVIGVANNGGFLAALLKSEEFAAARMSTGTIDDWVERRDQRLHPPEPQPSDFAHAAIVLALAPGGDWFRTTGFEEVPVDIACAGRSETVRLQFVRGRLCQAVACGEAMRVDAAEYAAPWFTIRSRDRKSRQKAIVTGTIVYLNRQGHVLSFEEPDLLAPRPVAGDPRRLLSPVAGIAHRVLVSAGDRVAAGDIVAMVEAMKMETRLTAAADGRIAAVHVAAGDIVGAGDLVAEIEPDGWKQSDG